MAAMLEEMKGGKEGQRTRYGGPEYEFARKYYWVEERKRGGAMFKTFGQKVFLEEGKDAYLVNADLVKSWYAVEDHVVYNAVIMPGAAHLCAVMEQKREGNEGGMVRLGHVELRV